MRRVEEEAHKVLELCGVSAPPVPVEEIARRLGATLSFERFASGVSGVLYRASSAVIAVNAVHAKTRQRFTIAHEIGHLRLHKGRPLFVDHSVRIDRRDSSASLGINREEIEANSFAATLLMPESLVAAEMAASSAGKGVARSKEVVGWLAQRFEVSPKAMEYRLANLGLIVPPQ